MDKYTEIRKIIEEAEEYVEFGEYVEEGRISEFWIERAEKRLNFPLPESYKWWLRHYGGGEIFGEEVYSLYKQDFDTVVGGDIVYSGDIVYMHELNKKQYPNFNNKLEICDADQGDQVFYFDISQKDENNEYPIYEYYSKRFYAKDFIEFLKKRILEID